MHQNSTPGNGEALVFSHLPTVTVETWTLNRSEDGLFNNVLMEALNVRCDLYSLVQYQKW